MRALWVLLLIGFTSFANNDGVEARLDRDMRMWQKRLGLEAWNISLEIKRRSQIDPDVWGTAEWDPETKTGVVRVLDPRDYNLTGNALRLDMECTIVHELVHIQLSPLSAPNAAERETVVNQVMSALLNRRCPN
jgi:hypothetical protein